MADGKVSTAAPRGVPPTLEWVPIERLEVDDAYQRSIDCPRSRKLIDSIVRAFDWSLCQPLACVRREGGRLFVVDGQHRLTAARARGDIPHMPCVITNGEGVEDEAAMFAALNRQRKPLSRIEVYRAGLAAGSPDAVEAAAVLSAAGLTLARHTNPTAWKPGQVSCIGGVARHMKKHGPKPVERALIAIAEAYEGEVLSHAGSLLHGLMPIYVRPPEGFDPDLMIEALSDQMQDEWLAHARAAARFQLRPQNEVLTENLLRAYEKKVRRLAA